MQPPLSTQLTLAQLAVAHAEQALSHRRDELDAKHPLVIDAMLLPERAALAEAQNKLTFLEAQEEQALWQAFCQHGRLGVEENTLAA